MSKFKVNDAVKILAKPFYNQNGTVQEIYECDNGTIYMVKPFNDNSFTPGYLYKEDNLSLKGKAFHSKYTPRDKEFVWAYDDDYKYVMALGFYDAKNNSLFQHETGTRTDRFSYDNYEPYLGEYPEWAEEACKKLED